MEPMTPKPPQKKPRKPKKTAPKAKRGKGRPKGSTNKNQREVVLNTEMTQVQSMLKKVLKLIGDTLQPIDFVYDGAFGNNAAVQMTRSVGLHLISTLRYDSALYFEWDGVCLGKGSRPRDGKRVDYAQLPECHLKSAATTQGIRTCPLSIQRDA